MASCKYWTLKRADGDVIDSRFPALDTGEAIRCVRSWYLHGARVDDASEVGALLTTPDGQDYYLSVTR